MSLSQIKIKKSKNEDRGGTISIKHVQGLEFNS